MKPQHIGIVACSAEGAALCYRTICTEGAALLGPHAHPEVSMHTHSFADYVACLERGDWQGVGRADARLGGQARADRRRLPDLSRQHHPPGAAARRAALAAAVAAHRRGGRGGGGARGFRRVGLTGTRWLVESEVYPEKLAARGLDYVRPNAAERDEINRIIMDELVYGVFKPEAVAYFQRVIARMKDEGCDAVVLGCTEIPLIISDANSPLPTLDSTRLLARAALRRAVQGEN